MGRTAVCAARAGAEIGRISETDGSMTWFVDLGNNVVDMLSRREISIQLRRAVIGRSLVEDDDETDDDAEMD
jgi:hypothetical protein